MSAPLKCKAGPHLRLRPRLLLRQHQPQQLHQHQQLHQAQRQRLHRPLRRLRQQQPQRPPLRRPDPLQCRDRSPRQDRVQLREPRSAARSQLCCNNLRSGGHWLHRLVRMGRVPLTLVRREKSAMTIRIACPMARSTRCCSMNS